MIAAARTMAAARSQTLSGAAGADAQRAERDGVDVARRSAGRCERFAKIQRLAKLRDRFLPLTHGGDVGRSAQPSSEQLFAEVRAGAREQLEQRGGAEDIEIARVQMIFGEKARSRLPDAVPSVFESRDAVFVKRDGAIGAIERAKDAIVPYGQRDEGRDRQRRTTRVRAAGAEHEPTSQRERSDGGEARVADARVEAGEARMFRCARRPPVRDIRLRLNWSNRRGSPCDPI